jgi:hypothetical protein
MSPKETCQQCGEENSDHGREEVGNGVARFHYECINCRATGYTKHHKRAGSLGEYGTYFGGEPINE